ncbi:response regulator transcription factor [Nakamurella sp. PAMC28650]|uniref:response regulator n=1 Tax=Nakamurella sp. PAMC28650 TaxID=2762325 RepID=UPI00164D078A|nr:response regulator transcription factor [Nakamurella sp. PAMC28650]QNK79411.1 response regulator transcription factor [Nakamurella sp. PAMC28650]
MITVLLVDDQPLIRLGFRMVLGSASDLELVGEAENGAVAVRLVRELDPDVVLMDIRMPVMDGIEATREITASAPRSKVLILTTFDLDEYAFAALNAGASGLLLKDADPTELINAVRTISRGDAVIAPRMTRRLLDTFADRMPTPARRVPVPDNLTRLTPREREVLIEVAAGLSNSEIAERLTVAETTVKTHLGRILSKLGLRDRVQVVVFAYQNGMIEGT